MSRSKNMFISMIISGAVLQISCMTTPVTVTSSTTPLQNRKITADHGRVQGSHKAWSVFGLWMIGRPDIDLAIKDALSKKGGDALVNVTCYERTAWFFFVSMHQVFVEGDAVSLEKEPAGEAKERKDGTIRRKR